MKTIDVRVHHRFGHVFLRVLRKGKLGRESVVVRLDRADAKDIAWQLIECADKIKPAKLKLVMR